MVGDVNGGTNGIFIISDEKTASPYKRLVFRIRTDAMNRAINTSAQLALHLQQQPTSIPSLLFKPSHRFLPMEDNMWVGYRFTPTDELLVCHFLFNKVRSLLLPAPSDFVIPELDVYDKVPWDLDIRSAYFLDHESYCFVRVCRSKEAGDERSERKACGGTWIALDKPHEILRVDTRAVAGSWRSFKFFVDIDDPTKSEEGRRVATGWMMHEYRLDPSMYPPQYKEDEEMILCRIWQGKQIRGQRQQPSGGGFSCSRTDDRHTGLNTNPNAVA